MNDSPSSSDVLNVITSIVASALETSMQDVSNVRFETHADWDSLTFAEVVFQVEEVLGVEFEEADFPTMIDPAAIAAAVDRARNR